MGKRKKLIINKVQRAQRLIDTLGDEGIAYSLLEWERGRSWLTVKFWKY